MHSFSEYFLLSEKTGWRLTDFDFDAIDMENVSEADVQRAHDTAVTESAVPHYTAAWSAVDNIDAHWELRQFAALWAGEEHRHSEGLRMLYEALGGDMTRELEAVSTCDFVGTAQAACPTGCYATVSGLLTYTTIQELVTQRFYRSWAKTTESRFIKGLIGKIAADEMRHHQWFANALQRYLADAPDPTAYRQSIVDAVAAFHMPHSYFPLEFPYFDAPELKYFSDEDVASMKEKIVKVLAFDQELVMMLLQVGEEELTRNIGRNPRASAAA